MRIIPTAPQGLMVLIGIVTAMVIIIAAVSSWTSISDASERVSGYEQQTVERVATDLGLTEYLED